MPDDPERESPADWDMVTFFHSAGAEAEMEALGIRGILDSNGIPSLLVGTTTIPSLDFYVQVPRGKVEEARRAVEEAQAAGSAAAEEAEEASEGGV